MKRNPNLTVRSAGLARRPITVPEPSRRRFYGYGLPNVDLHRLAGRLMWWRARRVGALHSDCPAAGLAGRLRARDGLGGFETLDAGERRVGPGAARKHFERTTLSLFYATDFADQLENIILPGLKAGFMVLADQLHLHPDGARPGARHGRNLLKNLYGIALVPDAVFYLNVSPEQLMQRNFAKNHSLDYWESGMDLGLSREMFDSFLKYQELMAREFQRLQAIYVFSIVDGDRSPDEVNMELQRKIEAVLKGK